MTLLKFSASWCQPCKTLTAQLSELGIPYTSIDVDTCNSDLIISHKIRSVPTLVLLDASNLEVAKLVGKKSNAELKLWLKEHYKN